VKLQAAAPHSALQSAPATHVHAAPLQSQPVPVQVVAGNGVSPSPPQPTRANAPLTKPISKNALIFIREF